MKKMHLANQRYWNALASDWKTLRDQDQYWRKCHLQPELAFEGEALSFMQRFMGELQDKKVLIIGSGDNYAAFALAGMGASVTSLDISKQQLEIARQRAAELELKISFVCADASDMHTLAANSFDLVCSSNGFFVWISNPGNVIREVHRALKPGGFYIFYDIHPFLRPWKDQKSPIEMEKPYFETGPFVYQDETETSYEFHWRISDIFNPFADLGFILRQMAESPASDPRFWEGHTYTPGEDQNLLDWHFNPRAGLPVWLTVAMQKS